MFSQVTAPKKKKAPKTVKAKPKAVKAATGAPQPVHDEQIGADYECAREVSPDPMEAETLQYDLIDADADADAEDSGCESENYDAASMEAGDVEAGNSLESSPVALLVGSLDTSPALDFFKPTIKGGGKKGGRRPGIVLTFDDDSWIV